MASTPDYSEGKSWKGKGRTLEEAIRAAAQNEGLQDAVHASPTNVVTLTLSVVHVDVSNPNVSEYRVVLTDP